MTEAEWKSCREFEPMLEFSREKASARKLRLLACALVRNVRHASSGRTFWDFLEGCDWFLDIARIPLPDEPCDDLEYEVHEGYGYFYMNAHQAVESMEAHADGRASSGRRDAAGAYTFGASFSAEAGTFDPTDRHPEAYLTDALADVLVAATSDDDGLVDSIVCSQRRLASFNVAHGEPRTGEHLSFGWNQRRLASFGVPKSGSSRSAQGADEEPVCRTIREIIHPYRRSSPDAAHPHLGVRAFARYIYESRAHVAMKRLGAMLESLGCEDAELLEHCRSDSAHARGCWAIDELLGQS